jgi:hypothetical protein
MNAGEYGIQFQFGTGFDMSSNTSLSLAFTRPDNTTLTVTAALGTTLATPFLANQWVKYTLANGDIPIAGTYKVRALYNDGLPSHLISDIGTFVVGA